MLCNSLIRLSQKTWKQIADGRKFDFQFQEETITENNLFALKKRYPKRIRIKSFNKREEGKNGADWEWWFKHKSDFIGFRIQAKILNIGTESFEHLHYQNFNTKAYQSDKLIIKAFKEIPYTYPLYCFYLQTNDSSLLSSSICPAVSSLVDIWGCSLMSAFNVVKLRSGGKNRIKDIQSYIKPWHCFFCCPLFGKLNPLESLQDYVKTNFNIDTEIAKNLGVDIPDTFITQNPPFYVLSLLNNELSYQSPDNDLDGVALFLLDIKPEKIFRRWQ